MNKVKKKTPYSTLVGVENKNSNLKTIDQYI
jgi:hypothetical protein